MEGCAEKTGTALSYSLMIRWSPSAQIRKKSQPTRATMKVCTFDENDAAEMVEDRPPLIPYVRCDIGQSFCADADLSIVAFLFEYKNSRAEYNREIGKLVQQEAKMNLENCQTEIPSRINCRL